VGRMEEIRAGAGAAFHKRLKENWPTCWQAPPWTATPGAGSRRAGRPQATSPRSWSVCARTRALDALLSGDGEVGKRLDFLLQEMNREANTVLSKTGGLGDLGLTMTELALAASPRSTRSASSR